MSHWLPAYVGLGSNLDDPAEQVRAAVRALRAASWAHCLQVSQLYGSAPLAGRTQPDFCNAVAAFLTELDAENLLAQLRRLETALGREPVLERWASRRIDLDLLCFSDRQRATAQLTLPHPGITQRNFVLYPLTELAPDLWLPGLGRVAALAGSVSNEGIWLVGAAE